MADYEHGPYPEEWGERERKLWDSEPMTYRAVYNDSEWGDLQDAFQQGWIEIDGITYEERKQGRDDFFDIAGIPPRVFNWEAFRDYLAELGSPSVH